MINNLLALIFLSVSINFTYIAYLFFISKNGKLRQKSIWMHCSLAFWSFSRCLFYTGILGVSPSWEIVSVIPVFIALILKARLLHQTYGKKNDN